MVCGRSPAETGNISVVALSSLPGGAIAAFAASGGATELPVGCRCASVADEALAAAPLVLLCDEASADSAEACDLESFDMGCC